MAGKGKKTSRSVVANLAVRYLLGVAGQALGGCDDSARNKALEFFGRNCAYSGGKLPDDFVWDHAVPINLEHCGLHIAGNLVPCTSAANSAKHHRHWQNAPGLSALGAKRIDEFIKSSPYGGFSAARTEQIRAVCLRMSEELGRLLARHAAEVRTLCDIGEGGVYKTIAEPRIDGGQLAAVDGLPKAILSIRFVPSLGEFRQRLLQSRRAQIVEYYGDGRTAVRDWNATQVTETSNLRSIVRTKGRYKGQKWRASGIVRLEVTAVG